MIIIMDGWRRRGRPGRRSQDDLDLFVENWPQAAIDRKKWRAWGEVFAQQ